MTQCKYNCGIDVQGWDLKANRPIESSSGKVHTFERCKQAQVEKKKNESAKLDHAGVVGKPIISNDKILEKIEEYNRNVIKETQIFKAILIKLGLFKTADEEAASS